VKALVVTVVVLAVWAGDAGARSATPSCSGAQLAGSFKSIAGSAGAGSVGYALVLRNRSQETCTIYGLPSVRLIGKSGKLLPTKAVRQSPASMAIVLVTLAPGQGARATARFSPDVPGVGEPTQGARCEPVAYRLRVKAQGSGTTTVAISPPTAVCEHGRLLFVNYALVRS
jgi:Protein of unknown function (DUF4232)